MDLDEHSDDIVSSEPEANNKESLGCIMRLRCDSTALVVNVTVNSFLADSFSTFDAAGGCVEREVDVRQDTTCSDGVEIAPPPVSDTSLGNDDKTNTGIV